MATVLVVGLLDACSSKYLLEPGVVYECRAGQMRGYVVSDGTGDGITQTNEGKLYVDEGKLVATPRWVKFKHRGLQVSMEGGGYASQDCMLTPYFAPKPKQFEMGPDYQTPRYEIRTRKDLRYGTAVGYWTSYPYTSEPFSKVYMNKATTVFTSDQNLLLDVYEPVGDDRKPRLLRPLLVMVHGGAFFNGDKQDDEYRLWCEQFAACGYVAVSVNYRLGYGLLPTAAKVERAGYRAVQDVNAAIRYMLANADRFNIDPNRIYLAGCSAGAIASLNVAFMTDKDRPASVGKELGGLTAVSPEYDQKFSIRAICNMWGAMANLELLKRSRTSLLSIHSADDPVVPYGKGYPFQSMLGSVADFVMPVMYGSSEINKRAKTLGLRTELVTYPIPKHTVVRNDPEGSINQEVLQDIFGRMTRFFYDDMVPHPAAIRQLDSKGQMFTLTDATDVADYDWQVQGGVILERTEGRGLRALLFSDAPRRSISLSGQYRIGLGFTDHLDF